MKDIIERAAKTFVQSFFGVLVPELAAVLSGGFDWDMSALWVMLAPTVAAGLAAGISAVWNIVKQKLEEK